MQGGTLRVCTMGDEVNPCVATQGETLQEVKGSKRSYCPADATATHCLLLQ